jgi:hypothetical protein
VISIRGAFNRPYYIRGFGFAVSIFFGGGDCPGFFARRTGAVSGKPSSCIKIRPFEAEALCLQAAGEKSGEILDLTAGEIQAHG